MIKIGQDDFVHINWVVFVYKKKRTRKRTFGDLKVYGTFIF